MANIVTFPKNGSLLKTEKKENNNVPFLSRWFDDVFFNEFPSVLTSNFNHGITLPSVNIKETADKYLVEMAVPGMQKSDFEISIDNYELSIASKIEEQKEDEHTHYTRREFGYAAFKRTFSLPDTVDDSKINATYNNGILAITLPKREEAKQKPARNIKIS